MCINPQWKYILLATAITSVFLDNYIQMFIRKSFINKKTKHGLQIYKYLVMFFLWASAVMLMTQAFNIVPISPNVIQYIKTIFLTTDGSNTSATGIILEWSWGDGRFKNSITVNNLPIAVVVGTNASGKLIASTSGAVYNFISWFALSGPTWAAWPQWIQWIQGNTGAIWPIGPQWPQGATGTFDGTETDPIYIWQIADSIT